MTTMRLTTSLTRTTMKFSNARLRIPLKPSHRLGSVRNYAISAPNVIDLDHLPLQRTPWLMLSPEVDGYNRVVFDRFYSPAENLIIRLDREGDLGVPNTAKCFASTKGWLGFVEPKDDCPVYMVSPYANHGVKVYLPSLSTLPCILGVYDRKYSESNGLVVRFKKWNPKAWRHENNLYPYNLATPEELVEDDTILNLSISSNHPTEKSCVVVATEGGRGENPRLTYHNEINGEWKAVLHEYDSVGYAEKQVVYSDKTKLFYAIHQDCNGNHIHALDLHGKNKRSPLVMNFCEGPRRRMEFAKENNQAFKTMREICKTEPYLVAMDNGDILYILRHYILLNEDENNDADEDKDNEDESKKRRLSHKTVMFDVFRLNFYNHELERVKSLGDKAIFIGGNQSFSVPAENRSGVQGCIHPNSIYFIADHTHLGEQYTNVEVGIYDIANGSVKPCYPLMEGEVTTASRNKLLWVSPFADCH